MRVWKEKRGCMRHYDLQASIYNVQYLGEQNDKIEDILKHVVFSSNETVLDLGCGTGFLFPHINSKVGLLVGLDVSQKALREAKNRTKSISNIFLVRADADHTPFQDNVFDKVFAITVLQNMPKPEETLVEMKRTAKPHATFAVTGLKKKFTSESFAALLENAKLAVVSLNVDERLKGYVALCKNL